MVEQVTLTTPVPSRGGTSLWRVKHLTLHDDGADQSYIKITLVGENEENKSTSYYGEEAITLMRALNKADMSAISLHTRVLTKLVNDGKIGDGVVSGDPD